MRSFFPHGDERQAAACSTWINALRLEATVVNDSPTLVPVIGLPSLFAGGLVGMSWAVVDGPGGAWRWLLALVFVLMCLVAAGAWVAVVFLLDADSYALPIGAIAAVALVISIPVGVNRGMLHERDATCRVLDVDEGSSSYIYRLDCADGGPSSLPQRTPLANVAVGESIRVRYNPENPALPRLANEPSDGQIALQAAGAALGVIILVGIWGRAVKSGF